MRYLLIAVLSLVLVGITPINASIKPDECTRPRLHYITKCDIQSVVCQNGLITPEDNRKYKCDEYRRKLNKLYWLGKDQNRFE